MSVRIVILLLALPLFLLLAAINSLLLYRQDTAGMEAGLRDQALSAAVTVAEFAGASGDPSANLSDPRRLAALRTVRRDIPGLSALYLSRPGQGPINLLVTPLVAPRSGPAPAAARVLGTWQNGDGRPLITALAPVGRGAMVVADIDAEPLARRSRHLKRLSIALIGGSAVLAFLIGLVIARRVIGEFRRTRAMIETHSREPDDEPLGIREVRDLADAVRLIDASVSSELQKLGGPTESDMAIGIAEARARHVPDISERSQGWSISIRVLAAAPPGSFYLHRLHDSGCDLIIGVIEGDPARALALAVALRSHVLAYPEEDLVDRYHAVREIFGVRTDRVIRRLSGPVGLSAPDGALKGYAARNPRLDTDALTRDLSLLFPGAAIIAAANETASQGETT